jgi:hypothetical protein
MIRSVVVLAIAAPALARAQPVDDGYCDYVGGVADATAAPLLAPQLFGQFGYIEQPQFAVNPTTTNLRAIGGLHYRLSGIYEGLATKARADADCRRHRALLLVRGASEARALSARVKVYDDAMADADKILAGQEADLTARRTTAQEATATRLRVEELRTLAADAHRQLAALPAPDRDSLGSVLATFHTADADMEDDEAKLRKAQTFEVGVRFGVDQFLEGPTAGAQYFAAIEVGVNLGLLWVGSANDRAAAGRKRYVRSGHDPLGADATIEQLRATIDLEAKRSEQTQALVADLDRQLAALARLGGEDSKRYRETVWFDAIKAKAELAYLQAHVAGLREVIAGGSE